MSTTAPSCFSTAWDIKVTNSPTRARTTPGSSMSDMPVNPRISANRITIGERSGLSASLVFNLESPLLLAPRRARVPRHAMHGPARGGRNSTQAGQNGATQRAESSSISAGCPPRFANGAPFEYAYYSNVISSSRRAEYNFFIPARSTGILNSGPEARHRGARAFRPATKTEVENGSSHRRRSAGLHGRNHRRKDPLPRMDRGQMGDPVLTSQGLHARLHHRARLHGEIEARVRQAQHQDHRAFHRSGQRPQELGEGHPGDARDRSQLSDDRRRGPGRREALRHDPSQR